MAGPLSSALLKIKRAKEHIADVEREVEAFQEGRAYTTSADYDAEPGRTLIKLRLLSIPTATLICAAADAVQNLRSALDHLAWQVYLRHRKTVPIPLNPKKVAFTVFYDRNEYLNPAHQKLIKQIGGAPWLAFVDDIEPYLGGNNALYALNAANNLDKHRYMLDIAAFPKSLKISSPLGVAVTLEGFRRWAFQDEITIASHDGRVEADPDVKTAFDVVFAEVEGIGAGESAVDTLHKIADAVATVTEKCRTRFFP